MPVEIEIGRIGTHTDGHGITKGFTPEFFAEVMGSYNPKNFRAPFIISHDTKGIDDRALADHEELAFGSTQKLKVEGDRLKAVFDKVSPKIVDHFRNGELLSVSPSFYPPKHRSNPTPGKWSLRHVAALGKTPPAIKGLAPIELSEGEQTLEFSFPIAELKEGEQTLEFCLGYGKSNLLLNLREWLIVEKGLEDADRILPREAIDSMDMQHNSLRQEMDSLYLEINSLRGEISKPSTPPAPPIYNELGAKKVLEFDQKNFEFSQMKNKKHSNPTKDEDKNLFDEDIGNDEDDEDEDTTTDMNEQLTAGFAELKQHNQELERKLRLYEVQQERMRQQLQDANDKQRYSGHVAYCETLVKDGRVTSSQIGDRVVNFSEGEAEMNLPDFLMSLNEQQLAFMEDFLSTHPTQIDYGEFAPDGDSVRNKKVSVEFRTAPGLKVSDEAVEEYQEIVNYCEQNNLDVNKDEDFNKAAGAVLG